MHPASRRPRAHAAPRILQQVNKFQLFVKLLIIKIVMNSSNESLHRPISVEGTERLQSTAFPVIPPIETGRVQQMIPQPPATPKLKATRSRKKKSKYIFPPSLMTDLNLKENLTLDVLPKIGESRRGSSEVVVPQTKNRSDRRNDSCKKARKLKDAQKSVAARQQSGSSLNFYSSDDCESKEIIGCESKEIIGLQIENAAETPIESGEFMITYDMCVNRSRNGQRFNFTPQPPSSYDRVMRPSTRGSTPINKNMLTVTTKPPTGKHEVLRMGRKDPRIENLRRRALQTFTSGSTKATIEGNESGYSGSTNSFGMDRYVEMYPHTDAGGVMDDDQVKDSGVLDGGSLAGIGLEVDMAGDYFSGNGDRQDASYEAFSRH